MSDNDVMQMEQLLTREPEGICNNCKHWLNKPNEVIISRCKIGMIIGACYFDQTCKKWKLKKAQAKNVYDNGTKL